MRRSAPQPTGIQQLFRSKERDIATDADRLRPISTAVEAAIRDCERELRGITARLQSTTAAAAFLFGDGLETETVNRPIETQKLDEAEAKIVRGEIRSRYLQSQLSALREVQATLESVLNPRTVS
jgi:hypothetical protein